MKNIFGSEGCLNDILSFYEHRDSQESMAEFVFASISNNESAVIEAPTGTGKTLAYLIPALKRAISEGKVLAITTETKSLQKQIIEKDIPILKKIFKNQWEMDFKASLCLGSANYPCRKRLEVFVHRGEFHKKYFPIIDELYERFNKGEIVTQYDVEFPQSLWRKIQRDSDICGYMKCPFFSACVFQKVKKEWKSSNLLIMNHYLFFANIGIGKTYLPHFDYVVFDEAHSVERIAASQLGFSTSKYQFDDIIGEFWSKGSRGIIYNISDNKKVNKAEELCRKAVVAGKKFFNKLSLRLMDKKGSYYRFKDPLIEGNDLAKVCSELLTYIDTCEEYFEDEELAVVFDSSRAYLFSFIQNLNMAVYAAEPDWVYWVEGEDVDVKSNIQLKGMPIDVRSFFIDDIYPYYDSVIFTSATLTIGGSFEHFKQSLGADLLKTMKLESPFDYKSNVLLYISNDMPDLSDSRYVKEAALRAAEIIKIIGGNCLLLFTSYDMLEKFKDVLLRIINNEIYSQGEFEATQAVRRYKESPGSILMGTHSFWQGLDLPGDLLRGIIMTRLPFSVPDRPDVEAKIEKIKKAGGNAFLNFQLPEAVIKFRQGFGRLIRQKDDYGVVTILDNRIVKKSYGKMFLNSIPQCQIAHGMKTIETFLDNKNHYESE